MRIVICDDVKADAEKLRRDILSLNTVVANLIDVYYSSDSLLQHINSGREYDLFFLDVDMPDISGIELGKRIKKILPASLIVFVTGYPQFAIEGYDCEALRYLLKPYSMDKLEMAVLRAKEIIECNKHSITVRALNGTITLDTDEIYYLEYCRRHILYHLNDRTIECTGVFGRAYDELKNYGFYQVHQGYIVNLSKIFEFNRLTIILDNRMTLPISVRKKSEVMTRYAKYLQSK